MHLNRLESVTGLITALQPRLPISFFGGESLIVFSLELARQNRGKLFHLGQGLQVPQTAYPSYIYIVLPPR